MKKFFEDDEVEVKEFALVKLSGQTIFSCENSPENQSLKENYKAMAVSRALAQGEPASNVTIEIVEKKVNA